MEIYDVEMKGIRASGYLSRMNKFVVIKGSFMVGDLDVTSSLSKNKKRMELKEKLISNNKIKRKGSNKYLFIDDVEFNSPSEAASIIWGSNRNGRQNFGIAGKLSSGAKSYREVDSHSAVEGYQREQTLNRKSRNRGIVNKRKHKDNYTCQICEYKMKIKGKYIIECHHLYPIEKGERITSIESLISLCPNCHRIIHSRKPMYKPNDVKKLLATKA